jgi:hypothetical protein
MLVKAMTDRMKIAEIAETVCEIAMALLKENPDTDADDVIDVLRERYPGITPHEIQTAFIMVDYETVCRYKRELGIKTPTRLPWRW